MRIQCVPLLRLIFECGVTGAWLATTPGSGDSAISESRRLHLLLIHAIELISDDAPDAMSEKEFASLLKDASKHATAEGRNFEQRCRKLDGGAWLYANYRLLSQFSHAGAALIDAYLVEEDDENPRVGHPFSITDPQEFEMWDALLALGIVFLHMSLLAWSHIDPGHVLADELAAFAEKNGIRTVMAEST